MEYTCIFSAYAFHQSVTGSTDGHAPNILHRIYICAAWEAAEEEEVGEEERSNGWAVISRSLQRLSGSVRRRYLAADRLAAYIGRPRRLLLFLGCFDCAVRLHSPCYQPPANHRPSITGMISAINACNSLPAGRSGDASGAPEAAREAGEAITRRARLSPGTDAYTARRRSFND